MTFLQAKKLVLKAMRTQGIKIAHVSKSEIEKAAIAVLQQAETQG